MGRGPRLSVEKRAAVTALHNDDRSVRYIANKLIIPRSTVSDAIIRFQRTGCNKDKTRTGRPRITSKSEDQSIVLMSKRNRKLTAPEIQSRFNENHEHQISVTTVKDRLHKAGLWGRVSTRKPFFRRGTGLRDFSGLIITKTGPLKTGNKSCGPTNRSSRFLVKNEGSMSVARLRKKCTQTA